LNPRLSRELGSRHRAAIGVTEETDAVAVVVSEETGTISLVLDGRITRKLDAASLSNKLRELLEMDDEEAGEGSAEASGEARAMRAEEAPEGVGK
jgi:diadenylate cyclase